MITVQESMPLHAPPKPASWLPELGVAVRVTVVPAANSAEHEVPQEMPAGALVTVPSPVTDTLRLCWVAVAEVREITPSVQVQLEMSKAMIDAARKTSLATMKTVLSVGKNRSDYTMSLEPVKTAQLPKM